MIRNDDIAKLLEKNSAENPADNFIIWKYIFQYETAKKIWIASQKMQKLVSEEFGEILRSSPP